MTGKEKNRFYSEKVQKGGRNFKKLVNRIEELQKGGVKEIPIEEILMILNQPHFNLNQQRERIYNVIKRLVLPQKGRITLRKGII